MDKINHEDCQNPTDADFIFTTNGNNLGFGGADGDKVKETAWDYLKSAGEIVKNAAGKVVSAANDALNDDEN